MKNENIIKSVRTRYNLSYSELAQITGAKEGTLIKSASTGEIGAIIRRCIEWYIESKEKEEKIKKHEYIKTYMKEFLDLK